MCGTILENGEDVMEITCKEGSDKDFYPNSYEVCRECARKVDKFIRGERGETKTCASCLNFDHDEHGPKCKFLKEYLPKSVLEFGCDAYYKESDGK